MNIFARLHADNQEGCQHGVGDLGAEGCVAERRESEGRQIADERLGCFLDGTSDDEKQEGGEEEACVGDGHWVFFQEVNH